jgi:hypothetical protein
VASLQVKAAKTAWVGKFGQSCQLENQQPKWNQQLTGERIALPTPLQLIDSKQLNLQVPTVASLPAIRRMRDTYLRHRTECRYLAKPQKPEASASPIDLRMRLPDLCAPPRSA